MKNSYGALTLFSEAYLVSLDLQLIPVQSYMLSQRVLVSLLMTMERISSVVYKILTKSSPLN